MMSRSNYIEKFGIAVRNRWGGADFPLIEIGYHHHSSDEDVCTHRSGLYLVFVGYEIFIGLMRLD